MTEQHTPTPHPFAKEITEWLKDTSQPLMYIVEGSDRWHSGTVNNGPSRILETMSELAGVHVGNNPPPKESVYFDRKHYTINAPVKDASFDIIVNSVKQRNTFEYLMDCLKDRTSVDKTRLLEEWDSKVRKGVKQNG